MILKNVEPFKRPFRNKAGLTGDELLAKIRGRDDVYIKTYTPDLVKAIVSDINTVAKLPLCTKLYSDIFLKSVPNKKYTEKLLWSMSQKTLFDFLFTDMGTLAELILEAYTNSEDKEFALTYLDYIFGLVEAILEEDEDLYQEALFAYDTLKEYLDENL